MPSSPKERREFAVELLKIFPPSILSSVANLPSFRTKYDLKFDATVAIHDIGISIRRSVLFPALQTLYRGPDSSITVKTIDNKPVELSIERAVKPAIFASVDGRKERIPSFWMLADNRAVRSAHIEDEVANLNLPSDIVEGWKKKLEDGPLDENEIERFMEAHKLTAQNVAAEIREEFTETEGRVSVLIPKQLDYYRGLIGDRGQALNIEEYAKGNAKAHIDRLLRWDFGKGLAHCLLFCANPRLSALIDISDRPAAEIEAFFDWLSAQGDRFSQIAGIEIGIKAIKTFPRLEPLLVKIIEEIRDEDPHDQTSRLSLTSNLFVFSDGELARTRIFANDPPFWRRLAATAQASMIERSLASFDGTGQDSAHWASLRAEQFYMQSLADLRLEPRWLPDLMTARQLQIELLMRARIAGAEAKDILPEGPLKTLIVGDGDCSLATYTSVPSAYAPSPVEGGMDAPLAFPEELLTELRKPVDEKPLETKVFAGVVNYALVFKLDSEIVGLIAGLLRKVKYRLSLDPDQDIGFTVIMGLAAIAAAARHPGLAEEVRILTRVLRRRGDIELAADSEMRIALLACASRADLDKWGKSVGEWLFEIANGSIDRKNARQLRSHLRQLCLAVPTLWTHVSKVDAALAAVSG